MKSRLVSSSRLILLYSLFSSLIILLISAILILQSSGYIRSQILGVKAREKEQLDFYLKEQIVGPVYNELIRDYFSRKWDPGLPFFFSEKELSPLETVRLQQQLQDFVFLHDAVHSVFLLNVQNDALLSTFSGASSFSSRFLEAEYPFERVSDLSNGWQIFSYGDKEIMSFFQKVPFSSGKQLKGYVVLNFDLGFIRTAITDTFNLDESLVIWKSSLDDAAILYPPNEDFVVSKDLIMQAEHIFSSDKNSLVDTVIIFSSEGLNTRLLQSLMLLIGIGLLAVLGGTFFMGIFTSVMYKPVKEITSTLNDYLPSDVQNIDEIKSFLKELASRSADADAVVEKNKRLNRYKLITDVFSGIKEHLEDHSELTGFPVKNRILCGTAVKIDPGFSDFLDPAARELLFEQIMLSLDNSITCIGISTVDSQGILCSLYSAANNSEVPDLNQLFLNLQRDVPVPLSIGGGPIQPHFSKYIYAGLAYTHVDGYNQSYLIADYKESIEYHLSVSEQKRIMEWLKSGKCEHVLAFIDDIADRCQKRKMSVESLKRCEERITELAEETLKEFGLFSDSSTVRFNTYEDYKRHLDDILKKIQLEIKKNKGNQDDLAQRIISYLERNVDAQTSIQQVAEIFSISSGYLSRLLSTYSSSSFKDIVKRLRLSKAAERLISEPDLPVSEIVRDLGYSTQAYFSSLFKAQYGLTPAAYRKKHIIEVTGVKEFEDS